MNSVSIIALCSLGFTALTVILLQVAGRRTSGDSYVKRLEDRVQQLESRVTHLEERNRELLEENLVLMRKLLANGGSH